MNSYLINSELIKQNFFIDVVDLKFSKSIKGLEKFSLLKVFKAILYGFKIVSKVIAYKPDLVYFTLSPAGFAFYRDAYYVFILKLLNFKIVFHMHGKGIKKNIINSSFNKWLYTWVFKNTYVICLSEKLSTDIKSVYQSVPFIVPNGIPVQPISNQALPRKNGSIPKILYVSNYVRNKGVLVLIEALGVLKNKGYDFNAKLVGAPSNLTIEMLNTIVCKEKLAPYVQVLGPLHGDDKFVEFKNADIFVFPTYNDSFPLVSLEAMQFSLPVISTFEGSIPDIVINNETGFLVETKNAQMLADKIEILLENKDLRIAMGEQGHVRFKNNYTLSHFEANINKTFQNIFQIS